MTLLPRVRVLLALVAVCGVVFIRPLAAGQQPGYPEAARTAPLSATIPVDPAITVGKLPNGLRYYIKANKKPEKRAELRLVVNAGSVLEDDNQRGLAHLVEHMSFNGTTHFPHNEVVLFLQSLGMQFGAHINAYTSFDETVYQLQVPTDHLDVLDRSMLVLEDWAHNVTFDPVELAKEREVVQEEWRLGLGAGERMQAKQFPVLLEGSRYAERMPIGKPEIFMNAKSEDIKRFYTDWYRPDLMAVVAVGDFDKSAVETLVKEHFTPLQNPASEKPRPVYNVPEHPGTRYAIATDKEATASDVTVFTLGPARDQTTVAAYRDQQIVDQLFTSMLSSRLEEISQKADPPFIAADAGRSPVVRTAEAKTLSALVKDGELPKGLDAVFTETARVAKFGFTQTELDRSKQRLLRAIERAVTEHDNEPSSDYAAEFIRDFTTGEPIPGLMYENELYHRFIPGITLADINALAKDWVPDRNRVVVASAPEKPGLPAPTEASLASAMREASTRPLQPYVDAVANAPLLASAPTPGSIVNTSVREDMGITEWTLSNGAHVILKPTTNKEDEILMRAFAPGGTSLASDKDFTSAATASQIIAAGGVGKLSAIDLQKLLSDKVGLSASPFISDTDEGVSGQSSKQDVGALFELTYLRFTAPRADPTIFNVMTTQTKAMLANQEATPDFAFGVALESALTQDHPRARPLTPARVDEMNLDTALAFYKARFADASHFTFVFVGSFDPAALKPLAEKYLASLPATHAGETWKDVGIRPPTTVVTKRVEKGVEPKSTAAIVFTGPFTYDPEHRVELRALVMALQTRLTETLREDLGGTYGVNVQQSFQKIPYEQYRVEFEFGCSPDRTDELVKRLFTEIDNMKTQLPSESHVEEIRLALQREYESSMKSNGYLLSQLALRYEYGEDPATLLAVPRLYNSITPQMIQQAAQKYLNTNAYVQVTLFPEKK